MYHRTSAPHGILSKYLKKRLVSDPKGLCLHSNASQRKFMVPNNKGKSDGHVYAFIYAYVRISCLCAVNVYLSGAVSEVQHVDALKEEVDRDLPHPQTILCFMQNKYCCKVNKN